MIGFALWVATGGNPSVPGGATNFQISGPWGQTDVGLITTEVFNQLLMGSEESGREGMYFNFGTINGPATPTPVSVAFAGITLTNGLATLTLSALQVAQIAAGWLCFSSIAGFLGLCFVNSIAGTTVTLNQNFTGTTGASTLTFTPLVPAIGSVNAIRATS